MIVLGLLGLKNGDLTPIWTGAPKDLPAREVLAYLCAIISLASGLGLLWRRTAVIASCVILTAFVAWWLVFRVPLVIRTPTGTGAWWSWGYSAVLIAAAWALAVRFARDEDAQRLRFATGETGLRLAKMLCGLGL